jgi:histidinol phosphatase-like PHP family hydrolase
MKESAKMTRRSFVGGIAAGAAVGFSMPTFAASPRWYKGMLHAHSLWSDGRVLPEQAVKVYKDAGYDFFSLTDHNRIQHNPDRWFPVGKDNDEWPPRVVGESVYEVFRRDFPDAPVRTLNGKRQVRLATLKELRERFDEPGKFLLLPGCEVTTKGPDRDGRVRELHMNYVGIDDVLDSVRNEPLVTRLKGGDVTGTLARTAAETAALAERKGAGSHVFFLNHPQWRYYDIHPQSVIDAPEVRFFEVCNNGSSYAPDPLLPQDGFDNDRFWDAVNATRAKRGEKLLYGVASDDTHHYPGTGSAKKHFTFGGGWIVVRAGDLTQEALLSAMHRGDFYASCGVEFEDIAFDRKAGRLSVSLPAKPGVAYTVRFITTKRSAALSPVRTVTTPSSGKAPVRDVPVYSDEVGAVVKTVTFAKGVRAEASYTLADDDLYVRARVESDEPTAYSRRNLMHPKMKTGWTQPYTLNSRSARS